jgi:type I restriction enzyme S subunit
MKNDWPVKKLGEIVTLINGRAFKSSEWKNAGIPIIRIQNLNDNKGIFNYYQGKFDRKNYVQKEDLLFSWSGSLGTSFGAHLWQGPEGLLNQHIFRVITKDSVIDKSYLYFFLNKIVKDIEGKAHGGAGLVHITKSELEKMLILLPNLLTQKNIVKKLNAIRKTQKLIDLQIQKTEELFNSISYIAFQTGSGNKLGKLFTRQMKTILPTTQPDQDFNFIGLESIESNKGVLTSVNKTKGANIKSNKFLFRRDNILYGKLRPYLNKVWLADFDGICSTDIWVLRANEQLIRPVILAALLRSKFIVDKMSSLMTGTSLPRANATSFDNLDIKIPALEEQQSIVEKLTEIQEYKKLLFKQKHIYRELFDSVLYKSMKGKI